MSNAQSLGSHRTFGQRFRRWLQSAEPGRPSRRTIVLLYLLLAFLAFVDYTVLTQAFVIIQAEQSTRGSSIGAGQALIVGSISLAAIFLPHAAAWGLQRRSLKVLPSYARWLPWAAIGLWAVLVGGVTFLRLIAANTVVPEKQDNTVGAAATDDAPVETAPFDPAALIDFTNPSVVLSYFMLMILLVSAVMAYLVAVIAHNPLRSARHASERRLLRAEEDASSRAVELQAASAAVEDARLEASRDAARYEAVQRRVQTEVQQLRADVRTILASSLGNPEETSRLIRELLRTDPPARNPRLSARPNPTNGATP